MMIELLILPSVLLGPAGDEKPLFEDGFDGRLAPGWEWVREDKDEWRIREEGLEVHSQFGRIWGGNDAKNLLLAKKVKPENMAAVVSVAHEPKEKWEQAGLLWYVDDDNFVKLISEQIDGKMYVVTAREQDRERKVVGKLEVPSANIQLRLKVELKKVTGQWRPDQEAEWIDAGTCEFTAKGKPRFGIFTQNGSADTVRWVRFDNFSIEKIE